VKAYGRNSFFVWWNPVAAFLETTLGLRVGLRSDADVRERMQSDVFAVEKQGYRVVSADEIELPGVFGTRTRGNYHRVTFELTDDA